LGKFDQVLGLGLAECLISKPFPVDIVTKGDERQRARAAKDFKRADELRKELESLGYEVKDNRDGTMTLQPKEPDSK